MSRFSSRRLRSQLRVVQNKLAEAQKHIEKLEQAIPGPPGELFDGGVVVGKIDVDRKTIIVLGSDIEVYFAVWREFASNRALDHIRIPIIRVSATEIKARDSWRIERP